MKRAGRVYIEPGSLQLIRNALFKRKRELGGALEYHPVTHQFRATKLRLGHYDSVQIPKGRVDFHTHPVICKNKFRCALEVPSAFDIAYLYDNQAFGINRFHFVFTRMGTYRIRLLHRARKAAQLTVQTNPAFRSQARVCLLRMFGKRYVAFNKVYPKPGLTLKSFRATWCALMRDVGFEVKLFLHPQQPYLPLRVRF